MVKPAAPAVFHLRIRLQSYDGKPFANHYYRIKWGNAQLRGKTDDEGVIVHLLDGCVTHGVLDLCDANGQVLTPKLTIPLTRVSLPPPPARPSKGTRPGTGRPRSPPPILPPPPDPPIDPPPVTFPNSDAAPEVVRDYHRSVRVWREYYDAIERWKESGDQLKRDAANAPAPSPMRPGDFDPAGRGRRQSSPGAKPAPGPAETAAIEQRLDSVRDGYHRKQVRLYEIAWRLHNLGFLGLQFELQFPIDGAFAVDTLLDAIVRYTFKHRLPPVYEQDVTGEGDQLERLFDHLRSTHDDVKKP